MPKQTALNMTLYFSKKKKKCSYHSSLNHPFSFFWLKQILVLKKKKPRYLCF